MIMVTEYFANKILNDAQKRIKGYIVNLVKKLYLDKNEFAPNFDDGENYCLECEGISFSIEVDNSYLDVYEVTSEERQIKEIVVDGSDNLWFVMEDDDECNWDDVDVLNLAGVANILQNLAFKK